MASSLQDPEMARSLWLQRRSTWRSVRRAQWRGDWTPVGLMLLLFGLLILLSLFLPSREAVERIKQAAQDAPSGSQQLPVVGVLSDR